MARRPPADRAALLYALPALAVAAPVLALAALLLGVGPPPLLLRICRVFLIVAPATGLLGLRTLSRVGGAAPEWAHRTARTWCALAFLTPVIIYLGLRWLGEPIG